MKHIKLFEAYKKSLEKLESLKPLLAKAAQEVYDDWNVEEYDEYAGGGVCHVIAEEMCSVMSDNGIECTTFSHSIGEVHVSCIAKLSDGVYSVDISPYTYETGGGYNWKKIPDVEFSEYDINIDCISRDPKDFNDYLNENLWGDGVNRDFDGTYIKNNKDQYEYIGWDNPVIDKRVDDDEDINITVDDLLNTYLDQVEEIKVDEFLKYVSIDTLTEMFPIYKDFDPRKDWHLRCYRYKDILIFVKSGYQYTFKEK